MKIAFWSNQLSERGTEVAMFDYAYHNQTLLHNISLLIYDNNPKNVNATVLEKFAKEMKVIGVSNFGQVDKVLRAEKCDLLYVIKYGTLHGPSCYQNKKLSMVCKSVVHAVFSANSPHGDVYATISPYVRGAKENNVPCVPHMVYLPENNESLRRELDIPFNATVFGRYGGFDQFNIEHVWDIVYQVAQDYPNIYFLFANTQLFCPRIKNIIHIEKIIDMKKKVAFINTCDAMLHARSDGETFGLSVAEFSIKNKPVFTTRSHLDNAHIMILGDKGVYYNSAQELYTLLTTFNPPIARLLDWNAYKDFTPENVMAIFKATFTTF